MHSFSDVAYRMAEPLAWFLIVGCGISGLIAVVNPKLFEAMVTQGGRWVDTEKLIALLDKRFDVDRYVLPYSRILGALVIAAVSVIGFLYSSR